MPGIKLTSVPAYGTFHHLSGIVIDAPPSAFRVIVCIKVAGCWWVKPFRDAPLTPIRADGTFTAEVVTGGNDDKATELCALLVPADYWPPDVAGSRTLPEALVVSSVARATVERTP